MSDQGKRDKGRARPGGQQGFPKDRPGFEKRKPQREFAPRQFGKPAPKGPYGRPAPAADAPVKREEGQAPRVYGRPAPQPGDKTYGRLAGDATQKRFGRPAPAAPASAPEPRRYGKPAPAAPASTPEPRRYGRSAPDAAPEPRRFARPAQTNRPSQPRPFGRPAFDRPQRPAPARQEPPRQEPILSRDARQAALLVLNRVLEGGAYASLSLDEVFSNMRLSPQDKRLAAAIVYKTIEDLLKIDFALGQFLQDAEALTGKVRNILRLSACQILLLDKIPDFAAVNEAVELTRASGLEDMTGLVNGVLRSLIRQKDSLPWPEPGSEQHDSIMYSTPQWLLDVLFASYPEDVARQIAAYRNPDHAMAIRRNQVLVSEEEFFQLLVKKVAWEKQPGKLPQVTRIKGASDIAKDLDFLAGKFSIQGEGSMLAVLALAPKVGMTVLDCCAAPGGKTCYLAELMQNTGRVHAWDVHEHRVDLIYAQAERLRLYNIRPAARDATVYQERFEASMDAVLLDAPCTGTGVMDNKPDIKYRLSKQGLDDLSALQASLLSVNARYVKPGGVLVYSTCSLLPQENEEQIKAFLLSHPDFVLDPLPESVPEQYRALMGEYGLQLLPHRDGLEGFFIARLKRV